MRLTSEIFVSALMRRVFADGGFAAVSRKGATEAGAIFVVVRGRMGEVHLYGPAPQASYDEARPDDRAFAALIEGGDDAAVAARIERELRFDPDLWLVELEPGKTPAAELILITMP